MKTKFKFLAAVVILAAITMSQINLSEKSGDLLFLNIEALASGESSTGNCIWTGSVVCPRDGVKVYAIY